MKRLVCILVCLLLCTQVFATPSSDLEKTIHSFIKDHSLDETNFSVSIYNTKTGESYAFNDNSFIPVGNLWILPLHMYFYEQEELGTFEPTIEDPEPFTIQGMSLEDCRYRSIILSEEAVAEKMRAYVGSMMKYQELINVQYGQINPDELPPEYWNGQVLSVEFLMNCLKVISARPERFGNLMANFRMVQKADAFAAVSVPFSTVQIRAEQDGYITAVAEVTAPQTYLIAASVKETAGGDELLADLNEALCTYIEVNAGLKPTEATQPTTQKDTSKYYIGQERLESDNTLGTWFLLAFGAAGVIVLILSVIFLIRRAKHRKY